MTYQKYCDDLKRFNQPITMSEKEWNSAYGIQEEYTPFIARKSSSHKNVKPTIQAHIDLQKKPVEESQPQAKNEELIKKLDEMIKRPRKPRKQETQKRKPRHDSTAHLSPDERRAYHSKKRLEHYHANKVLKPKIPLTDEQKKEKKSEYRKSYEQKIKEQGRIRKPLTEAQKEAHRLYKINYRRERGIQPRTKMSEEERRKRKKEASIKSYHKAKDAGKKRILTPEQRKQYTDNARIKRQQQRVENGLI